MSDLGAPRGPIFADHDARVPDLTDGYAMRMAQWRQAANEEAVRTAQLSPEHGRMERYISFLEGNHSAGRKARYKSNFYINRTRKARIDSLAMLTDSRPSIEVTSRVEEFSENARMIHNVLGAEWHNQDMDLSLITAVDIAGVGGTSFWKIGASRPGMMKVTPCGFDVVQPIQPGFHIQQSTAVKYGTFKSLGDVLSKFPMHARAIESESVHHMSQTSGAYGKPDHMERSTWDALAPQMQRMLGTRGNASETTRNSGMFRSVEWQEYYIDDLSRNQSNRNVIMRDPYLSLQEHNWWYEVKPGERLYPRKRLVIFAGSQVIYDGPSPYWHGLYPFSCLRLDPVFWSFWGLSKYRDVLPVNSAMNEIVAGILDMIKRALNQTVVAKGSSISQAVWKEFFPDAPGQKLYLTGQSANPASDIRYIDPPAIPDYVFRVLTEFLGPEFDKLVGTLDVAGITKKNQVPGGDTIEQMRDSGQTNIRLEGRYVESFLKDAGIQGVSNVCQFYTQKRRMQLIGPDGTTTSDFMYDPQDMVPTDSDKFDWWRNFPITVLPGSLHGGARDRSKMMYMSLRAQGAMSIRRLYEKLEIDKPEEALQELKEEIEAGIVPGGGAGSRMSRGQRNGSPV
jgi:hypothetical protein